MEKIKITNPFWLGKVAPFINEFLQKVPTPGITYEGFYAYLANTVQHGDVAKKEGVRDRAEFWVVMEDDKPIALAHWYVRALPYFGTVFCDAIYSWQRKKEPAALLLDEFEKFGVDHRAQFWEADAHNQAVFKVLQKACNSRGYQVDPSGRVNFVAWRKQ